MIARRSRMVMRAAALAMSMLTVSATAVLADDISNSLDSTVDAVAEVMPLVYPGATGTTTLYVIPKNEDGKNGCNLTGSTTLTISVASSNAAAATVSPSSVTFTSCGVTPTLTVTPQGVGTATISASQTANTTDGTFNLAPVTFTVNVTTSVTNTPPSVSVTGVSGGASYNKGSVPAAGCSVTDAEDGPSTFVATLSAITGPYASDGIGSQTASCSYTDGGGLTASASETYSIADPSAPVITYTLDPAGPDGNNGWYVSDVTLTWSVSDPESPNSLVPTGCVDQNIIADQVETTYSCSATSAGGSSGPVDVAIKRDATAPTPDTTLDSAPDHNGWYNAAAAWTTTGTDETSGIATCDSGTYSGPDGVGLTVSGGCTDLAGNTSGQDASHPFDYDATDPINVSTALEAGPDHNGWYNAPADWTTTGDDLTSGIDSCDSGTYSGPDGTGVTVSGACTDDAGNTSTAAVSDSFDFDDTNPSLNPTVSPNPVVLNGSATASTNATDDTSGVDGSGTGCDPVVTTSVGVGQTVACHATDNAGNTASANATYGVVYATGAACLGSPGHQILQPINANYLVDLSVFKQGSTVPAKFRVCDANGVSIGTAGVVTGFKLTFKSSLPPDAVVDEAVVSTTPDTAFRWSASDQQWIYNVSTKNLAKNTTYGYTISLNDGSTIEFRFGLR